MLVAQYRPMDQYVLIVPAVLAALVLKLVLPTTQTAVYPAAQLCF